MPRRPHRSQLLRRVAPLVLLACAALAACAGPRLRRFPLAATLWRDDDRRPGPTRPETVRIGDFWDFVDRSVLGSAEEGLRVERPREALNVNAMDEVPDSSWFDNRLLRGEIDPAAVARGACTEPPLDPAGPWTIVSAKPNGINPGFIVRGPDGHRYLLKADGHQQPERASAADAVCARVYYALGYDAPCNGVVYFDRAILRIDPRARARAGHNRIDEATLDHILSLAVRAPDGRYRMSTSLIIEGTPIGPWSYEGVREDDPNDVVPHEDRRELRASRLAAAWLDHYDTRDQNTLALWETGRGGGWVRHALIDFGDSFGAAWPLQELTARDGFAYTLDFGMIAGNLVSLGLIRRPWDAVREEPDAPIFGYFSARNFDAATWHDGEPNPAFLRMTERDGAWMARRIARLGPAHVRAAVDSAQLSQPAWAHYLYRTLMARREQLLRRYLTRLSPLADARVEGDRLCATDLATQASLRPPATYRAVRYAGRALARGAPLAATSSAPARVCVALGPHRAFAARVPPDAPERYLVVDVIGAARGDAPLRAHLYDLGAVGGFRLVGLERPQHATAPRP